MTMLVRYIRESEVDAYVQQGWQAWRMAGHHGARPSGMKNFIAVIWL